MSPEPRGDPRTAPGAACLQASRMLRRLVQRHREVGMDDQQALLAVCGLLDALGPDLTGRTAAAPDAVGRAVLRLTERLERADHGPVSG